MVIKSNKGKRDDRFGRPRPAKCHVATRFLSLPSLLRRSIARSPSLPFSVPFHSFSMHLAASICTATFPLRFTVPLFHPFSANLSLALCRLPLYFSTRQSQFMQSFFFSSQRAYMRTPVPHSQPPNSPSRSTLGRALSSSRMKRSFHCCSYPSALNTASHRHDRFHSVATREMEFRRRAQNPLVHAAMEICIRRCRGIPCTQISCH